MYKIITDLGKPTEAYAEGLEDVKTILTEVYRTVKRDPDAHPHLEITVLDTEGRDITETQAIEELVSEITEDMDEELTREYLNKKDREYHLDNLKDLGKIIERMRAVVLEFVDEPDAVERTRKADFTHALWKEVLYLMEHEEYGAWLRGKPCEFDCGAILHVPADGTIIVNLADKAKRTSLICWKCYHTHIEEISSGFPDEPEPAPE